eukprot:CAMPEP_0182833618 /NCGR_PEP_ID=MMETSP0006_2-20121128/20405_1 /TAXON_ID=97485 /ORGANISM="Prymnesium parvum, Strain Texoma1" /LENGTH=90 /DNA_ID=CAMNT_0024961665 /DNA_START=268 /DNA_END=541 /DNA_ORIENTATION=-
MRTLQQWLPKRADLNSSTPSAPDRAELRENYIREVERARKDEEYSKRGAASGVQPIDPRHARPLDEVLRVEDIHDLHRRKARSAASMASP